MLHNYVFTIDGVFHMTQAHELTTITALDHALEGSEQGLTLLFKHSSTCDLSAAAWDEFHDFLRENASPLSVHFVVVQTARQISMAIEQRLDILHESPQAILLANGKPVWHASHRRLTAKAFRDIVQTHSVRTPEQA
jgi:bacillithiol system protein YtxJ